MPALRRSRQEDWEFKDILSYLVLDQPGLPQIMSEKKEERGRGEGETISCRKPCSSFLTKLFLWLAWKGEIWRDTNLKQLEWSTPAIWLKGADCRDPMCESEREAGDSEKWMTQGDDLPPLIRRNTAQSWATQQPKEWLLFPPGYQVSYWECVSSIN